MPGRSLTPGFLSPHLWSKFGGCTCIWSWISSPLKNHVIRVIFQDHAMYARKSFNFRVQKTFKIWEKRVCFWSNWQIWKGHEDKIKKNACKNAYQGSIFISEKYAFRVCFKSPKPFYGDDIQWRCTILQRHQNFFFFFFFCGGHRTIPMHAYH